MTEHAVTFQDQAAGVQAALGITNSHAVPRITHVVLNVGVGKRRDDKGFMAAVRSDLRAISGQEPHERRARKAVAGFAVRAGNVVGLRVTLRGKRADDFVRRFVGVTLPRVRDFRGLTVSSLDGRGNLSVGVAEQLAFPEINPDKTDSVFGVQVTFATTARSDAEGAVLFRALGFPFREAAA
ncbi:MAG: 50S ribosomal protein L5 [Candidatus Andersenbacteria bacterium CG10_big_fil_rev_8_21_14_0_10_54_11]|uniref:Large ribosomal subunit protein uL5 n=1 Tax=Candidatus Andersenbacteria bacterium CG10_big_fil_rev_8_21_14_0_10_54_11 TaxID=1974485 RepID=A0A2M6WYW4_9BACT|nr:MAG: 50S ribosomal protein L5 [Candidatus Andersenbacteria bacterium CG10_big_fil_rev_8_21_14_0_10_54_11]